MNVEKFLIRLLNSEDDVFLKLNKEKKQYEIFQNQTSLGTVSSKLITELLDKNKISFSVSSHHVSKIYTFIDENDSQEVTLLKVS